MNWFRRLRVVTDKAATGQELDEELQFHIDHQIAENVAAGMSPDEARFAALREFGAREPLKEECRSARGVDWLEHAWQDLNCALRNFRRKPGIAIAVVTLTAVGIGATTAVFSVVDRVLFRALPYADAGRLVSLGIRIPWLDYDFLTAASVAKLQEDPGPLAAVTSWSGMSDCDVTADNPVRLACASVAWTFLPVLGVEPVSGRNFTKEEDQPKVPRVALISYALWKTRFAGRADAVGQSLTLDGEPARIVGVLPEDFHTPTLDRSDILLPQALPPADRAGGRPLRVYGRLRPGISLEQAHDILTGTVQQLLTDVPPDIRKQVVFHVRSLRDLETGDFRVASWTLFGAVIAMLLIACANAANLLLARSVARRQELAIRVALGAGRSRMLRQTLTETLALGIVGGAFGCVLAYALLRVFIAIAPAGIPHLSSATIDARVLWFGLGIAVACGVASGLAPAIHTPEAGLLTGVRVAGTVTLPARRFLVRAQVAISLTLLTCAAVLLQNLWNRLSVSLGMRTDHIVTARVVMGARYAKPAQRGAFYERLEAGLKRLPGVESVALSDSLPPGGVPRSQPVFALHVEGKPAIVEGSPGIVVWRAVTPGYFETLGIPILRGRAFTEEDRRPGGFPMIISSSLARRYFGIEDPVGRRMTRFPGSPQSPAPLYTIVGVAAEARNNGLTDQNNPEYYVVRRRGAPSYDDAPMGSAIIIRGKSSSAAMKNWLRTEIAALDPVLPAVIRSFDEHIGALAARQRFQAYLLALFAGIGLLLVAFGLYGLVSFLVAQRERELGVRLALGATPAIIVRMIVGDAMRWTLGGLVVGIVCAAAAAHGLRSLLFHVSPADPRPYLLAAVIMTAVALLAAVLPSRRAASVDPATTLRQD